MRYTIFHARFGWLGVSASELGLCRVVLSDATEAEVLEGLKAKSGEELIEELIEDRSYFKQLEEDIRRYFDGERVEFESPLDWDVLRAFQRRVLRVTKTIPYGETRSYKWVAEKVGNPKASRAVARALATNPLPIVVPCHRVIGSDGRLKGPVDKAAGRKRLLDLEGASTG